MRWFSIFCLAISVLFLQLLGSCATPGMPNGGPKDSTPPALHPKRYSTPNEMTNFPYQEVILTFDEWVKLQNAYAQIIISPPLDERPSIKVKNKSVVIRWKEALKPNTTYVIQYGESIQDLTEGNITRNMTRVFATGDQIDSLHTEGQIIDATTREPKENVLVMLYEDLTDSASLTIKPYYFTKTDKQGRFKLDYLKAGTYQIIALEDLNNDYKYSGKGESIAFLDSNLVINDSLQPILRMRLFSERIATKVTDSELLRTGQIVLYFNNPLESETTLEWLNAPADMEYSYWQEADSALIWLGNGVPDSGKLQLVVQNIGEKLQDTVLIKLKAKASWEKEETKVGWLALPTPKEGKASKGRPKIAVNTLDTTPILLHPTKPKMDLIFDAAVRSWNTDSIQLLKDTVVIMVDSSGKKTKKDTFLYSTATIALVADSARVNVLYLNTLLDTNSRYQLRLLPNAITDRQGYTNTDTLYRNYQFNPSDIYGIIRVTIQDMQNKQYIVQLVDSKERVLQSQVEAGIDSVSISYPDLVAGNYIVRVIEDQLPNARWDTGLFSQKRQPEPILNSKEIPLKKGWKYEFEMSVLPTKVNDKKGKGKKINSK